MRNRENRNHGRPMARGLREMLLSGMGSIHNRSPHIVAQHATATDSGEAKLARFGVTPLPQRRCKRQWLLVF